jgi:hypothetical protein
VDPAEPDVQVESPVGAGVVLDEVLVVVPVPGLGAVVVGWAVVVGSGLVVVGSPVVVVVGSPVVVVVGSPVVVVVGSPVVVV